MKENGYQFPCSKQQRHIHSVIGGELNFLFSSFALDIVFPEDRIYVEYDGGGHNLGVKLGHVSQLDFNTKELKRRHILRDNGWKEIRIISKEDKLPNDNILIEIYRQAIFVVKNSKWCEIDIDKHLIRYSQGEITLNLGELRVI